LKEKIEEAGGEVFLNHPVSSITQESPENVQVVTKNGKQFNCKYVIVATPITQSVKIDFIPPLPFDRDLVIDIFYETYLGAWAKIVFWLFHKVFSFLQNCFLAGKWVFRYFLHTKCL
jgi:flavin-dependent dehydrogenase